MKILQILLIVIFFFACSKEKKVSHSSKPSFDLKTELASIEKLRSNFELAIKEKRYEDMVNYISSDMRAVPPGSNEWEEFRKLSKQQIGQFSYDSIRIWPEETEIVSDSIAYDFGTSTVYFTDENGEAQELNASLLVIIKKTKDGKWKLHREVASALVK